MPRIFLYNIVMKSFLDESSHFINTLPTEKDTTIILGGGLAGLSAGYRLVEESKPVAVFESETGVGGLSRTIHHGGFSFDLGGHRFHAKNEPVKQFVQNILNGHYLTVNRKSKIYLRNKLFDYPLKPSNALLGLGITTTVKAIYDYCKENIKSLFIPPHHVSLEDWVVSNFGRTLFNIYFKEYSEKVWGIECGRISKDWVSRRIEGLSLAVAIKNAFFKFSGRKVKSLVDKFIYPPSGIGQISENLRSEIDKENSVLTNTKVERLNYSEYTINDITVKNCGKLYSVQGKEFISSIPLTSLLQILNPAPPEEIIAAASKLKYRDLVVVVVMLDKERVTDLTWMYLPEKDVPMGRIHEPKNWSPYLAPEGKTHIVAEYFCSQGDQVWDSSDAELTTLTLNQLEKLGLIHSKEAIDSCVVKVPHAYPILEVGYTEHYSKILRYLDNFRNLHIIGRTGLFKYYDMDRAIESGIESAENLLRKKTNNLEKNPLLI